MLGGDVTLAPTSAACASSSDVQVGDVEGVLLDKLSARLDDVAHEAGEDLVGDVGLGDFDAEQRPVAGVERRFPQLLGVHLPQPLVAGYGKPAAAGGEHRIEKLGRARDRNRLAGAL